MAAIDPSELQWNSVRCVFRIPDEDPNSADSWYEERLTLWQARSHSEAIEMAEAEAAQLANEIDSE